MIRAHVPIGNRGGRYGVQGLVELTRAQSRPHHRLPGGAASRLLLRWLEEFPHVEDKRPLRDAGSRISAVGDRILRLGTLARPLAAHGHRGRGPGRSSNLPSESALVGTSRENRYNGNAARARAEGTA